MVLVVFAVREHGRGFRGDLLGLNKGALIITYTILGFLIVIIVYWSPKGPYIKQRGTWDM